MIWLGIKKTNDKWLCKDPDVNLNGYEGRVSDFSRVSFWIVEHRRITFKYGISVRYLNTVYPNTVFQHGFRIRYFLSR